eukprot:jgi/Mesen1/7856/ME000042S07302
MMITRNKDLQTKELPPPKKRARNTYACQVCGAVCQKPAHLEAHLRTHTDERPFVCHISTCEARYKRQDHLNRHLLTHQGPTFQCTVVGCGIKCTSSSNLQRHLRRHVAHRQRAEEGRPFRANGAKSIRNPAATPAGAGPMPKVEAYADREGAGAGEGGQGGATAGGEGAAAEAAEAAAAAAAAVRGGGGAGGGGGGGERCQGGGAQGDGSPPAAAAGIAGAPGGVPAAVAAEAGTAGGGGDGDRGGDGEGPGSGGTLEGAATGGEGAGGGRGAAAGGGGGGSARRLVRAEFAHRCKESGCGRTFRYKSRLEVHRARHLAQQEGRMKEYIVCCLCWETFTTSQELQAHMSGQHKFLYCPDCGKQFAAHRLRRHTLLHDPGRQKFPCEVPGCDRDFVRRTYLRQHMTSVHGQERPFVCSVADCGRRFAYASNQKRHEATVHRPPLAPGIAVLGAGADDVARGGGGRKRKTIASVDGLLSSEKMSRKGDELVVESSEDWSSSEDSPSEEDFESFDDTTEIPVSPEPSEHSDGSEPLENKTSSLRQ